MNEFELANSASKAEKTDKMERNESIARTIDIPDFYKNTFQVFRQYRTISRDKEIAELVEELGKVLESEDLTMRSSQNKAARIGKKIWDLLADSSRRVDEFIDSQKFFDEVLKSEGMGDLDKEEGFGLRNKGETYSVADELRAVIKKLGYTTSMEDYQLKNFYNHCQDYARKRLNPETKDELLERHTDFAERLSSISDFTPQEAEEILNVFLE